jgi:ketosteroid isomerase-like protein
VCTNDVLDHHLKCFAENDLDGILADYSLDAVLFLSDGILRGPDAIKPFFQTLVFEFAQPGTTIDLQRRYVDGNYAYIVWGAKTRENSYEMATDTFVVINGKIVAQSFAAKVVPSSSSGARAEEKAG